MMPMAPGRPPGPSLHPPHAASRRPADAAKAFTCEDCGKAYMHGTSLRKHQRYECGKEPQFQCPFCPHRSKLRGNLKKHVHERHWKRRRNFPQDSQGPQVPDGMMPGMAPGPQQHFPI